MRSALKIVRGVHRLCAPLVLALSSWEVVLALPHATVCITLIGAHRAAAPAGIDEAPTKVNDYIGDDPAQ